MNRGSSACHIQLAGSKAVLLPPKKWSPKFTKDGRYDVFAMQEVLQLTIRFYGGGMEILPGRASGKYSVQTDLA